MALGVQGQLVGYFGGAPDMLQTRAAMVERLGGSFPDPSLEAVLAAGPDPVFGDGFNERAGLAAQNLRDADVHGVSSICPVFHSRSLSGRRRGDPDAGRPVAGDPWSPRAATRVTTETTIEIAYQVINNTSRG